MWAWWHLHAHTYTCGYMTLIWRCTCWHDLAHVCIQKHVWIDLLSRSGLCALCCWHVYACMHACICIAASSQMRLHTLCNVWHDHYIALMPMLRVSMVTLMSHWVWEWQRLCLYIRLGMIVLMCIYTCGHDDAHGMMTLMCTCTCQNDRAHAHIQV